MYTPEVKYIHVNTFSPGGLQMSKQVESTVDTLEMYVRIHEALDSPSGDEMASLLSRLSDYLATKYHKDTGTKVGPALGWDKPYKRGER